MPSKRLQMAADEDHFLDVSTPVAARGGAPSVRSAASLIVGGDASISKYKGPGAITRRRAKVGNTTPQHEDFEVDAAGVVGRGRSLPGQIQSPSKNRGAGNVKDGGAGNVKGGAASNVKGGGAWNDELLIPAAFGELLPIEEFDDGRIEQELLGTLQDPTLDGIQQEMPRQGGRRALSAIQKGKTQGILHRSLEKAQEGVKGGEDFVQRTDQHAQDRTAGFKQAGAARALLAKKQMETMEHDLAKVLERSDQMSQELVDQDIENKKLRARVRKLRSDHLEFKDRLEEWKDQGNKSSVAASSESEKKKFLLLEKRMKLEEQKRNALALGLEVEDEDAGELSSEKSFSQKLLLRYKGYRTWWHKTDTLYKDARQIESKFGSGVALYFWMFRFMMHVAVLVAGFWLCFFAAHWVNFILQGQGFSLVSGIPPLPTPLLYSHVPTSWSIGYAGALMVTIMMLCVATALKIIAEFRAKHDFEISNLGTEPARYAKLIFTAWDWTIVDLNTAQDIKTTIVSNFEILKLEDDAGRIIAERTQKEWTRLYIRRSIGISLNMCLLGGGWAGIIISKFTLNADLGAEYTGIVKSIITLLPVIIPSAINGVLPAATDFLVDFEKWDDPAFALTLRVGRLYLAKILNALIQAAVVLLFFRGPDGLGFVTLTYVLKRDCNWSSCEDQAAATFFLLFAVDVTIGAVSGFLLPYLTFTVFTRMGPAWEKSAKSEFQPPTSFIKVLYQQIFLWFCVPHFPASLLFALILWYIAFKVDAYVLVHYCARPVRPFDARNAGVYFTYYYAITLALFSVWFYYVFVVQNTSTLDQNCCGMVGLVAAGSNSTECLSLDATLDGVVVENSPVVCLAVSLKANGWNEPRDTPFQLQSAALELFNRMNDTDVFSFVISNLFNSPLFGWFAFSAGLLLLLYERLRIRLLRGYLEDKTAELNQQYNRLQVNISVKQKRLDLIAMKDAVEARQQAAA